VIVGMVLNSIGLSFDQPPSSPEQDPAGTAFNIGENPVTPGIALKITN